MLMVFILHFNYVYVDFMLLITFLLRLFNGQDLYSERLLYYCDLGEQI